VGEVKAINASFDRERRELSMRVEIDFWPERLFRGRGRNGNPAPQGTPSLTRLIEHGLRAQLRSANLLTGQQYVALEVVKGARTVSMDVARVPPEIPTIPGVAQELQTTIASIAKKLDSIRFEQIGNDLQGTLQTATKVLNQIDKDIAPAARDTLVEAKQTMIEGRQAVADARKALASIERTVANAEPLPLEASDTMREIGRAAQSFRVLADYLERHPEAVIRGKKPDAR
jgi:paraquat-inducible protein B